MVDNLNPDSDHVRFATKAEWVADALRRSILTGELKPGERLRQDEIAEKFQISSTPTREALQLLAAEGFVEALPHRGSQVARPETRNLDRLHELYLIRSVLEGLAVELAVPRLTTEEHDELRTLLQKINTAMVEHDADRVRQLNYRFHFTLYAAAQTPMLYRLIRNLWVQFPWDTVLTVDGRAHESAEEHRRMLQTVLARDPEAAGNAMRRHIVEGGEATVQYLANQLLEKGMEQVAE